MEYYHYVNIFETKGLEYILVICFLITLVLFVRNLDRPPKWQRRGLDAPPGALPGRTVVVVDPSGERGEGRTEPSSERTSGGGEGSPGA